MCKRIDATGEICSLSRKMPEDQWRVVIPDHHQGYITRDQFLANRKRLADNRTNIDTLAGPAREGLCLLQGLLLCGSCGRRLTVHYTGNGGLYPIYECNWRTRNGLPLRHCMSLPAGPLDDAIARFYRDPIEQPRKTYAPIRQRVHAVSADGRFHFGCRLPPSAADSDET